MTDKLQRTMTQLGLNYLSQGILLMKSDYRQDNLKNVLLPTLLMAFSEISRFFIQNSFSNIALTLVKNREILCLKYDISFEIISPCLIF